MIRDAPVEHSPTLQTTRQETLEIILLLDCCGNRVRQVMLMCVGRTTDVRNLACCPVTWWNCLARRCDCRIECTYHTS